MIHTPSSNSLLQALQRWAPELRPACQRVDLLPGLWPGADNADGDDLVFPETGLLTLSWPSSVDGSRAPHSTQLAFLGCHSAWSPRQAKASGFLAQVLVPGHAMRVSEARVRASDVPLAEWWLQVAGSHQQLVAQMARMALCAQGHSAVQRLASCLLIARHHSATAALQMPVAALREGLGWTPQAWHSAWHALKSHDAVLLIGQGASASIQIKDLTALSGLACACHQTARRHDAGQGS